MVLETPGTFNLFKFFFHRNEMINEYIHHIASALYSENEFVSYHNIASGDG